MKKYITIFLLMFAGKFVFAQDKPTIKKAKDTIKTEVINVVSSYTPKVTDAFKIKKKPTIKLSDKSQKKKLSYQIFPAPVASTFTPKKGALKGVDFSEREKLYKNYLAVGFGNNTTPYLETFLHHSTRFENDFGLYAKYISSSDPVKDTNLDSSFSNLLANFYYKQEDRYFDWKVGLDFEQKKYNWYGLPNTAFNSNVIESINEQQAYSFINLYGKITFEDNYINQAKVAISYFNDEFDSNEISVSIAPQFQFSLDRFIRNSNEIILDVSLDYLSGSFNQSYENTNQVDYSFFTAGLNPSYKLKFYNFDINLGTKVYYTSDIENSLSQFYVYPDVKISYPIIANFANLFVGAGGDLHTNSYKQFTDENPFISPTQYITQTNEKYNFYGGINGKLSQSISYNSRISYKQFEDKPLFSINNSKSDGTTIASGGINFLGYEYGNSFSVVYDDIKNINFFGEVEWDVSKNLVIGANGEFNTYTPKQQEFAWNLPKLKSELFAKYKTPKWHAGTTIYFASNRKDVQFAGAFPSLSIPINLGKYFDVNLNGGYKFSDNLSAFIKINNIFNNNYLRFTNYNVQGFQVLGGITYKFDF